MAVTSAIDGRRLKPIAAVQHPTMKPSTRKFRSSATLLSFALAAASHATWGQTRADATRAMAMRVLVRPRIEIRERDEPHDEVPRHPDPPVEPDERMESAPRSNDAV